MKKLLLAAGIVLGYVLGTRAGRERYAQIKRAAQKFWQSDPVQTTVEKAEDAAKQAAGAAVNKVTGNDADERTRSASPESAGPVPPLVPENPVVIPTGTAPQEGLEEPR